jgi:hypothetical protein
MEGSNEFNNQTMQTKEYIICINDETEIKQILQQCKLKDKNGIFIIKMHFVGLFIVLMII